MSEALLDYSVEALAEGSDMSMVRDGARRRLFLCRSPFTDLCLGCLHICDLIGLGRAAVLEPELPRKTLLNPDYNDDDAVGMSHIVRGQWFIKVIPSKVVGGGLPIKFFYYNMQRLGAGLLSDPHASLPFVFFNNVYLGLKDMLSQSLQRLIFWRAAASTY